jgi:hypothetical protein
MRAGFFAAAGRAQRAFTREASVVERSAIEGERCQTVYKPGSVPRVTAAMTIPLGRALRHASSNQPGRQRGKRLWLPRGSRRRPYSVLLPVRFAVPCPLLGPRCALTAPFHPCRRAEAGRRSTSLWHCLGGRPRRALPGTVFPWSPDFPRPMLRARERSQIGRGHPTVWHGMYLGASSAQLQAAGATARLSAVSIVDLG